MLLGEGCYYEIYSSVYSERPSLAKHIQVSINTAVALVSTCHQRNLDTQGFSTKVLDCTVPTWRWIQAYNAIANTQRPKPYTRCRIPMCYAVPVLMPYELIDELDVHTHMMSDDNNTIVNTRILDTVHSVQCTV